jgi:hypothetical protein
VRGEVTVAADEAEDGRNRHDRTSAGRGQPRHGLPADQEDAAEVRVEDCVPSCFRALVDRAVAERAAGDAVCDDDGVEPFQRLEHGLHVAAPREIGLFAIDGDDSKPGRLEGPDGRCPDPARSAGDDGDLPRSAHVCIRTSGLAKRR